MLWNSWLPAAAESRKVSNASDETPSASGVLRGKEVSAGAVFLHPPERARSIIAAMNEGKENSFIGYLLQVSDQLMIPKSKTLLPVLLLCPLFFFLFGHLFRSVSQLL